MTALMPALPELVRADLRKRADRLANGGMRTEDLDRIYLGLRTRDLQNAAFREIGDFIAHRDVREKGLLTQVGRDAFTSLDVWSMSLRGLKPTLEDFKRAAEANLRLASDDQIRDGCGCGRQTAKRRFDSFIAKLSTDFTIKQSESRAFEGLANRFIWKPAFTDKSLSAEFAEVLIRNDVADEAEREKLEGLSALLTLHAVATMHGSTIAFEGGATGKLFAGYANKDRWLEVKLDIRFDELGKPMWSPIALFHSHITPEMHCAEELILRDDPVLIDHWPFPLEVNAEGKLQRLE